MPQRQAACHVRPIGRSAQTVYPPHGAAGYAGRRLASRGHASRGQRSVAGTSGSRCPRRSVRRREWFDRRRGHARLEPGRAPREPRRGRRAAPRARTHKPRSRRRKAEVAACRGGRDRQARRRERRHAAHRRRRGCAPVRRVRREHRLGDRRLAATLGERAGARARRRHAPRRLRPGTLEARRREPLEARDAGALRRGGRPGGSRRARAADRGVDEPRSRPRQQPRQRGDTGASRRSGRRDRLLVSAPRGRRPRPGGDRRARHGRVRRRREGEPQPAAPDRDALRAA